MSSITTNLVLIFMGLYGVIILIDIIVYRTIRRFFLEIGILLAVFIHLRLTTGFPSTRQAFGGVPPIIAIAIMFVCTLLGISARYWFYLRGKFTWISFLRPFCLSPIVLLPLIGSIQRTTSIESIQLISFGILAFQNGFFWKVVFEHAKIQI